MNKKKLLIIVSVITVILVSMVLFFLRNNESVTYKITFDTSGGSLVETQIINEGDKVIKPNNPTKDGYTFIEWFKEGKVYDFNLEVTSNFTLTAKWLEDKHDIEKFIVKFNTAGAQAIESQIIEKGNKAEKPIDPVKEGYIFKGWLLNDVLYDFDSIVDKNIELKSKFEKVEDKDTAGDEEVKPKKYTVSFNSNGGSNVNSQTVTEGNKVQKPSNPSRTGYTFEGWTLNGKTYDFGKKVTSNISLVAKWKKLNSYIVTFDSNGGSLVNNQTVYEGGKVTQPSNPSQSGYTFAGWTLNGKSYDFNSKVTSNVTLVAKWTKLNNYTVTFDSNGGSSIAKQTVVEGGKVTQPSNPIRRGYNFTGWILNGNKYNFDTKVTSNITLVANWVQKNYTISVAKVDTYSPDSILSVFEEGKNIIVQSIKYIDGTYLCSGTNTTVNTGDIAGETSFIVVLSDGTQVRATLR